MILDYLKAVLSDVRFWMFVLAMLDILVPEYFPDLKTGVWPQVRGLIVILLAIAGVVLPVRDHSVKRRLSKPPAPPSFR